MRNTLALTLTFGGYKTEIHTLNPGTNECIERFGGSRHALFAGKTASIVTRDNQGRDTEMDIYDKNFWEWIARVINGETDVKPTASVPE